jgi:hypothetical protein
VLSTGEGQGSPGYLPVEHVYSSQRVVVGVPRRHAPPLALGGLRAEAGVPVPRAHVLQPHYTLDSIG